MSKSYKHSPFGGFTSKISEKEDKRLYNRKIRGKIKSKLKNYEEDEFYGLDKEHVSNVWAMDKDGKHYFGNLKDDEYYKKRMRK